MAHYLLNRRSTMEMLELLIRPECTEQVIALLSRLGIEILSIAQVEGVGRQRGHTEIFRGREYSIATRPKIQIEIMIDGPEQRDEVMKTLRDTVYTGQVGDGKVFVFQAEVPEYFV